MYPRAREFLAASLVGCEYLAETSSTSRSIPLKPIQRLVFVSDDFDELTGAEIRRILPMIMYYAARSFGLVLSGTFEADVEPMVETVVKRVGLA